jgi:hypothetical protein
MRLCEWPGCTHHAVTDIHMGHLPYVSVCTTHAKQYALTAFGELERMPFKPRRMTRRGQNKHAKTTN